MVDRDIANAMIMDHVTGKLPEPLSLVIASHIAINKDAMAKYTALCTAGGEMLEDLQPAAVNDNALDALMDKLESLPQKDEQKNTKPDTFDAETRRIIPEPLLPYLKENLSDLKWRSLGGGVREYALPTTKGFRTSLLSIEPGKSIPSHTHKGVEYTLVLDGAYEECGENIVTGDFVCNDASDTHQPIADPTHGCLCLAVIDAPLKFDGLLGWLINPFLKV